MPDTYHDDDPSNVKKVNRPLEQEWPEGGTQGHAKEELEMEVARQVEPEPEVSYIRHRKTPTERKAEGLDNAMLLARRSLADLEESLDEFSLADSAAAQEEYEAVVPVLAAYLDRIERRHRAGTK